MILTLQVWATLLDVPPPHHKGLSLRPGLLKQIDGLLHQISLRSPVNLMAFTKLLPLYPLIVTFNF